NTEVYATKRYITITGNHLDGTPSSLVNCSVELLAFHAQVWPQKNGTGDNNANGTKHKSASESFSQPIDDRLEVALHDPVFSRLWRGDTTGNNNDDSAADLALCNKIVFYFGPDAHLVDSIFRRSGLM